MGKRGRIIAFLWAELLHRFLRTPALEVCCKYAAWHGWSALLLSRSGRNDESAFGGNRRLKTCARLVIQQNHRLKTSGGEDASALSRPAIAVYQPDAIPVRRPGGGRGPSGRNAAAYQNVAVMHGASPVILANQESWNSGLSPIDAPA